MRPLIHTVLLLGVSVCASCANNNVPAAGSRSAPKTQSFEIALDDEVRVSPPAPDGTIAVEPSVAVHGDTVLVAWNDTHGGIDKKQSGVVIGWAVSVDGGRKFTFGGFLPAHATIFGAADSWLAADARGTFYLQLVTSEGNGPTQIEVYRMSSARWGTWERAGVVAAAGGSIDAVDKPAMDVSPDGRIAIAYTAVGGPSGMFINTTISQDGGVTWSKPNTVSGPGERTRLGAGAAALVDYCTKDRGSTGEIRNVIMLDASRIARDSQMVQGMCADLEGLGWKVMFFGEWSTYQLSLSDTEEILMENAKRVLNQIGLCPSTASRIVFHRARSVVHACSLYISTHHQTSSLCKVGKTCQ